jgi:hypothetical protein
MRNNNIIMNYMKVIDYANTRTRTTRKETVLNAFDVAIQALAFIIVMTVVIGFIMILV